MDSLSVFLENKKQIVAAYEIPGNSVGFNHPIELAELKEHLTDYEIWVYLWWISKKEKE